MIVEVLNYALTIANGITIPESDLLIAIKFDNDALIAIKLYSPN